MRGQRHACTVPDAVSRRARCGRVPRAVRWRSREPLTRANRLATVAEPSVRSGLAAQRDLHRGQEVRQATIRRPRAEPGFTSDVLPVTEHATPLEGARPWQRRLRRSAPMTAGGYRYKLPFVISASAAGTVIEWYDFYLYGVLAAFFSTQFFPPGNETTALLASLATFGAGFAVRPFGAAVFGRIGDLIGRKFTFLVTITVMGVVDGARRPAADLRPDRDPRADHPRHAPAGPGPRARRRVRRRRDLRGRAQPGCQARPEHELDPDDRDARAAAGAGRHRHHPPVDVGRGLHGVRLADPVPAVDHPRRCWRSTSGSGSRRRRSSPSSRRRARRRPRRGAIRSATRPTASSSCWPSSARPPARPSSGTRASSRRCSSSGRTSACGSRTPT